MVLNAHEGETTKKKNDELRSRRAVVNVVMVAIMYTLLLLRGWKYSCIERGEMGDRSISTIEIKSRR